MVRHSNARDRSKMTIRNPDQSGFRMLTVFTIHYHKYFFKWYLVSLQHIIFKMWTCDIRPSCNFNVNVPGLVTHFVWSNFLCVNRFCMLKWLHIFTFSYFFAHFCWLYRKVFAIPFYGLFCTWYFFELLYLCTMAKTWVILLKSFTSVWRITPVCIYVLFIYMLLVGVLTLWWRDTESLSLYLYLSE